MIVLLINGCVFRELVWITPPLERLVNGDGVDEVLVLTYDLMTGIFWFMGKYILLSKMKRVKKMLT